MDAASLSAVTPPGAAGVVEVTVTNPDGQSAKGPDAFTFVAPVACAVPATVSASLTLDPSCVWTVTDTVVVGGPSSPVLTILPGTTVLFAPNPDGFPATALRVGIDQPGSLVANGTSTAGIVLSSAAATPAAGDWGGVVLGPLSGRTSLQFATIAYAGGAGANDIPETAALTVEGGDLLGGAQSPSPLLVDLTINDSAGHGLVFAGLSTGFGPASGDIHVNNWETSTHYPLVLEANAGGTLPTSLSVTPAGGPTAVVAFNSYVDLGCNVVTTIAWPAIPLPYLALSNISVSPASQESPAATLTITAPNTIAFASNTELDVDPNVFGTGFLQANGTPTSPIAFTSSQTTPSTGAWGGINFWCSGDDQFQNSSLTYASVNWATSVHPANNATGEIAILNGTSSPTGLSGPVIANCSFADYAEFGLALVDIRTTSEAAYAANNIFSSAETVVLYCTGLITDGSCMP